jgi:hypothetical protein
MPIRLLIAKEHYAGDSTVLIAAFEDTLTVLGLVDRDDPATLLVAKQIMMAAQTGERDPARLRDLALQAIRGSKTAAPR